MHNKRANEQWQIISSHIDFDNKTVLDLGCGYGDILALCQQSGANVLGIEQDKEICKYLKNNWILVINCDLEKWIQKVSAKLDTSVLEWLEEPVIHFDIVICFSVLPYLNNPDAVLRWIADHSDIALIECQYAGDGPGFSGIKNDNDMQKWLFEVGWQSAEAIGKTLVDYRNKYRTIWCCR